MLEIDPQAKQGVQLGPVTVTAKDIQSFAEAMGDLNPLYLDAEAARAAGYPDVIGASYVLYANARRYNAPRGAAPVRLDEPACGTGNRISRRDYCRANVYHYLTCGRCV